MLQLSDFCYISHIFVKVLRFLLHFSIFFTVLRFLLQFSDFRYSSQIFVTVLRYLLQFSDFCYSYQIFVTVLRFMLQFSDLCYSSQIYVTVLRFLWRSSKPTYLSVHKDQTSELLWRASLILNVWSRYPCVDTLWVFKPSLQGTITMMTVREIRLFRRSAYDGDQHWSRDSQYKCSDFRLNRFYLTTRVNRINTT